MSSNVKYIGLDVHKEAISIAVLNGAGKLVMESILETKAVTLVQFLQGLRGELHEVDARKLAELLRAFFLCRSCSS